MSILRALWIIMWTMLAYITYGDIAFYIALAAHVGIRVLTCARFVVGRALSGVICTSAIIWLMYQSVHLVGWGCFWMIFFSFAWVTIRGERGAIVGGASL